MCYRAGKCTVCSHVRAAFGPEIVQAGAVKGGGGGEGGNRRFQFSSSCTGAMELGVGVGGLGRRSRRENGPDQKQTVLTRFQLCVLVSGRTSARFRFGSPFLSKRLWSVDTVL